MTKQKVWILDDEWFTHDVEKEIYDDYDIEYKVTRSDTVKEDFETFGKYADGIVAQIGFPCGADIISELENCKIIAASGVGFNHIDLDAACDKGIYVTNMADYCIGEVSDHTIALSLSVARRLRAYNEQVKSFAWNPLDTLPIKRLKGRTVGLLGFGRIAKEVARKFQVFGVNVIAHDEFVPKEAFTEYSVESVTLDELLERSDILSLHVPLTDETEGLLNYDRLKRLKEGSILINTCRGAIIQEDALVKVMKEGHLAGAGLDVLTEEPPGRDQELLHMEEVFVTPHSSYVSEESEYELRSRTSLNVIRAIRGETPEFVQNVMPERTS
ncbi:C-terminal binding protein [Sporosarcina cascadiensis]|uniref:C-terminal binding protein n=1 Tax=Sporosarcina cascadiensis TaxID=2660747 RepID=UPI00129B312E|nr:C-terminal binding protein [Sporosarcina cascadiensis]